MVPVCPWRALAAAALAVVLLAGTRGMPVPDVYTARGVEVLHPPAQWVAGGHAGGGSAELIAVGNDNVVAVYEGVTLKLRRRFTTSGKGVTFHAAAIHGVCQRVYLLEVEERAGSWASRLRGFPLPTHNERDGDSDGDSGHSVLLPLRNPVTSPTECGDRTHLARRVVLSHTHAFIICPGGIAEGVALADCKDADATAAAAAAIHDAPTATTDASDSPRMLLRLSADTASLGVRDVAMHPGQQHLLMGWACARDRTTGLAIATLADPAAPALAVNVSLPYDDILAVHVTDIHVLITHPRGVAAYEFAALLEVPAGTAPRGPAAAAPAALPATTDQAGLAQPLASAVDAEGGVLYVLDGGGWRALSVQETAQGQHGVGEGFMKLLDSSAVGEGTSTPATLTAVAVGSPSALVVLSSDGARLSTWSVPAAARRYGRELQDGDGTDPTVVPYDGEPWTPGPPRWSHASFVPATPSTPWYEWVIFGCLLLISVCVQAILFRRMRKICVSRNRLAQPPPPSSTSSAASALSMALLNITRSSSRERGSSSSQDRE